MTAVEYNYEKECYTATLADGEEFELDSESLQEAEDEAERIVDIMNDSQDNEAPEYSRFFAKIDWK